MFQFTYLHFISFYLSSLFLKLFLWGSSEGSFKYPLVAWEKVCLPVELGGLGIRGVASFNQALLGNGCGVMGMKLPILGGELS